MDWQRNAGPARPIWRARGRANCWVIVEASDETPFALYSYPRSESLKREREIGEYETLEAAKEAAERMEDAA